MELPPEDGRKITCRISSTPAEIASMELPPEDGRKKATIGSGKSVSLASMELPPEDGRKSWALNVRWDWQPRFNGATARRR